MRFLPKRRVLLWLSAPVFLAALFLAVANATVLYQGHARERDSMQDLDVFPVAIVLGASVKSDGRPSHALEDRLQQALELHRAGKAQKLLLSGDHGNDSYDETNAMRRWLVERGVEPEDLFCDHAGFTTYDTMARAKRIFGVETAIVVTQGFHLPRALYTAHQLGMVVQGTPCDQRTYVKGLWFEIRECGELLCGEQFGLSLAARRHSQIALF